MIANSVICNTIKVYNGYFVLPTDIRSLKFKLVAVYHTFLDLKLTIFRIKLLDCHVNKAHVQPFFDCG